jgi:hypothetical protein
MAVYHCRGGDHPCTVGVERPEGRKPHKFLRPDVGRMSMVTVEGRGIQVASSRNDANGLLEGESWRFPVSCVARGAEWASHRDKTMFKHHRGRKHDKRQKLVGYLKRFLRKPWFVRLVIGVAWKLLDRFF